MSETEIVVPVELGERSYDIVIGRDVLRRSVPRLRALSASNALIVSDRTVFSLHGGIMQEILENSGFRHIETCILDAGEGSKSYAGLQKVCEAALTARLERRDVIIALGGGVMGDLAGFAASLIRRGIRFVQVPTSLLAQVDSSVGGKTGINSPQGKNLIGSFYQPSLVLADTALTDTLTFREIKAGYAEIVKYGLINDAVFFQWCQENWQDVFKGSRARDEAVAYSCRAKAAIVKRDEKEHGERALLNLGHTFGHALERFVSYNPERLVHGEGVAIGLSLAFRFSVFLGLCPVQDAETVSGHLRTVGLPVSLQDIAGEKPAADQLLDAMMQDKKVEGGALTFILARGIGQSFVQKSVSSDDVRAFLNKEIG